MALSIWGLGDGSCPVHQRSRPLRRAPSRRLPASGNVSERAHLSNRAHTRPGGFEFADVSGSYGRLLRAIPRREIDCASHANANAMEAAIAPECTSRS